MKIKDLCIISIFSALIVICSWITIPFAIPFTMQLFGIFLASGYLGLKKGFLAILIYLVVGLIGLPVFSNFNGGIGVLFGPTGGYLIGFLFIPLIVGIKKKHTIFSLILLMLLSLIVSYLFGSLWFYIYNKVDFKTILITCVIPFILPDLFKILLSALIIERIKKI